jgi:hypothetical protein
MNFIISRLVNGFLGLTGFKYLFRIPRMIFENRGVVNGVSYPSKLQKCVTAAVVAPATPADPKI